LIVSSPFFCPCTLFLRAATAGDTLTVPIPGLDYSIGIASAGVVADIDIEGNADNLTLAIDINLCATIAGVKECGSDIPGMTGLLPIPLFNTSMSFSNACTPGQLHTQRAYADCLDGSFGGFETDIDCGGDTCPACNSGKACLVQSDCESGICLGSSVCDTPAPTPAPTAALTAHEVKQAKA
jgi:hypothetical protein